MDKIKQLIVLNFENLTGSEKHIATKILQNPKCLIKSSNITDFADSCSVSESTIARFSKKIGLNSFIELRTLVKISSHSTSEPTNDKIIDNICKNDINLINYYRNYDFQPIINLIKHSPIIYAYGTGRFQQGFVKEMQRLFMQSNTWIRVIEGDYEFKTTTNIMNDNDTLIIVSSKGENQTLNEYFNLLYLKNVNIISFTNSSSQVHNLV